MWLMPNIYRLLNVYCEIFGMSSYGDGHTSLRVRLRHINECRIFHNIHSITFFIIYRYLLHLSSTFIRTIYIRNQNIISAYQSTNCFQFKITLCHLVSSYIFKTMPNGAKVKMTFGIGYAVKKQTLTLTRTRCHC